ncbi:MAG: molybdopterin-guanine dinucleotide biosynthesis protein B [Candidatus Thermoplasmatota archaeon]|nr:molybdopterin-guanine dinucleotide biosynthesis protein B [Candidatus Thermoplasmatota archaeon]
MIIAVSGYKGKGKTSFVESLLSLLKNDYDVLTIKNTHLDEIDVRGKDTSRHINAGAVASAIIAGKETAIFFKGGKNVEEIVNLIDADIVLLEGFKQSSYQKIWIGNGEGKNIIMKNPGVEEAYEYIREKVEEERILKKLPDIDCGACGYGTCGEMAKAIQREDATIGECKALKKTRVKISVDGKNIPLKRFAGEFVENTINGMLSSLKGVGDVEAIKNKEVLIELS